MGEDSLHIQRVLKGETSSFEILVEKYQRYVFSLCLRVLKNREEAEEAAQDSFMKAFRKLDTFQQSAKFSTWLYKITWNTALDQLRSRKNNLSTLDKPENHQIADHHFPQPENLLQSGQNVELVQLLVTRLPEKESTILTLYYLHECNVEEITGITGFSTSNVKVILYRGRNLLRQKLEVLMKSEIKEML
ncbi:MAG: sigma-70 family RNA polymerase sigma factor [Bacteroidia bacterium]|nr:sigma-70 family RNA polymerase sigma factor [Bacteroidia bacterium]